ncbi:MAG: NADH-quinone oxidoreductase subunit A [Candidatus Latescibacterota bacterium]
MDYFFVLLFLGLSVAMFGGGLVAARVLGPRHPGELKNAPYECGEQPLGGVWVQYNVGFYLFGLLFLIFDVEAAFLYPWATAVRQIGVVGCIEVGIFLLVLVMGLVYAWRKGALEWL